MPKRNPPHLKSVADHAAFLSLARREIPLPCRFVLSSPDPSLLPLSEHPEWAFVGRSNVGKSSLLNFLAGQKQLARISSTPGRTQLVNIFEASDPQSGLLLRFLDLPGFGFASVPNEIRSRWMPMMKNLFVLRSSLVGVFLLVDARRGFQTEEQDLFDWFLKLGFSVTVVFTKIDKLSKSECSLLRSSLQTKLDSQASVVLVSALKKQGLTEIFSSMSEAMLAALACAEDSSNA